MVRCICIVCLVCMVCMACPADKPQVNCGSNAVFFQHLFTQELDCWCLQCDWVREAQPGNRIGHKEMCLKARRASGQTLATCSKSDVREHAKCADALRATAGARSTQARGKRRRAERASAQSTQARGRTGARCSRPSGPAFLFSFGRARKFAGRCRGGGAPGVGPQGHRASPAPPRTHAKHLSHSQGWLKVSVAPGCVLSCSSFLKGARVSRFRRIANVRTPNKFGGSETHTEVSQTSKCAARIWIRAARTILGGCPMSAVLSEESRSPGEHLGSERSPMRATRTRPSRYLPRGWHRESEGINDSRTLSDECRYPRERLGSEQKPHAGNAETILKIIFQEEA